MRRWIIILILVTGFLVIRLIRFTPGPGLYVFDRWTGRVLNNVRPQESEISVKKTVVFAIPFGDKAEIRTNPNGKVVYLARENEPFLLAKEKSSAEGWMEIYLQASTYNKIRGKNLLADMLKVSEAFFVKIPYFVSEKEIKLEKFSYEEKEHKTTFWNNILYFVFGSYDDSCIVKR